MPRDAQERPTNGQRRSALLRLERYEVLVQIRLLPTQKWRQSPERHEKKQAGADERYHRLEMNSLLAERECKKPSQEPHERDANRHLPFQARKPPPALAAAHEPQEPVTANGDGLSPRRQVSHIRR